MTREEAIEIVKTQYPHDHVIKTALGLLIPELRESEDERIRKELIEYLRGDLDDITTDDTDRWIAYLEKQKEPKDPFDDEQFSRGYEAGKHDALRGQVDAFVTEYNKGFDAGRLEGLTAGYNKAMKEMEQQEQKPAEKQDYSGLSDLERAIHRGFLSAGVENVPVTIIKETAKECLAQMKPAEWIEEDEKMRDSILAELANHICYNKPLDGMPSGTGWTSYKYQQEIDWLTNRLKSRRPPFKPSEEQMNELWSAISYIELPGSNFLGVPALLESLYEQLKKL